MRQVLAAGQMGYWGMEQPGRCQLAAPAIPPVSSATLAAHCFARLCAGCPALYLPKWERQGVGSWVSSSKGKTKPPRARQSGITNSWGCFLLSQDGLEWLGGRIWKQAVWDALLGCPISTSVYPGKDSSMGSGVEFFFRGVNISKICLLSCAPHSGGITWFAFLLRNITCPACSLFTRRGL